MKIAKGLLQNSYTKHPFPTGDFVRSLQSLPGEIWKQKRWSSQRVHFIACEKSAGNPPESFRSLCSLRTKQIFQKH